MMYESELGNEERHRPVVTSWRAGLEVTVEDTHSAQVVLSESDDEISSAVYDGGDSSQLQQRKNPTKTLLDNDTIHLISGAGSQLEVSVPSFQHDPSTVTTLPISQHKDQAAEDSSLETQIRASLQSSSGKSRDVFLPIDKLDKIITWQSVYTELVRVLQHERSQNDLQKLTHEVWDEVKVPESPLTTRRKVFATLVCINKASCITYFIDEDLYDCHLPFHFASSRHPGAHVYRNSRQGAEIRLHCFSRMGWTVVEQENFQRYQWDFQAPYFEIISDGKRTQPLHYALDDRTVLPFIEDSEEDGLGGPSMTSGGYSDVWRVRIHPAHHSHPSARNPLFAVKRLKPNNRNKDMFKREVATLKKLSGQDHAHLIKLQLTYLYRDRYHLLFRWADGNLRDYWQAHPGPSDVPRTQDYAIWVASQWLGLARGLLAIHHCPPDESAKLEDEIPNDGLGYQRVKGRHGDIKPENILWFNSYDDRERQIPTRGRLVISDFGLTEFHRDETGLVSPINVARSPTYRPPEYDVSENISQSYDIWTLGCVLLEFIVWYLQGFEAFDQFSKDRANQDGGVIKEDVYFTIAHNFQTEDGKTFSAAKLKESVMSQIDALRQDPGVTSFIVDALNFIEQRMLRMHPEKRASCEEVVDILEIISSKASENEAYCNQPIPGMLRRAPTDLSILPQSSFLIFDRGSRQAISDEEIIGSEIRAGNAQEIRPSHGDYSEATYPKAVRDVVPPEQPTGFIDIDNISLAEKSRTELVPRSKSKNSDTDLVTSVDKLQLEQKRTWLYRLFGGCFGGFD